MEFLRDLDQGVAGAGVVSLTSTISVQTLIVTILLFSKYSADLEPQNSSQVQIFWRLSERDGARVSAKFSRILTRAPKNCTKKEFCY